MRKYRVQWTALARQDLTDVVQYIAADSMEEALRQLGKIENRAKSLNQHPLRGRIVPELKAVGLPAYRELVIRPWQLLFRIDGGNIYVIALLDSRRNLEDILLDRLINIK